MVRLDTAGSRFNSMGFGLPGYSAGRIISELEGRLADLAFPDAVLVLSLIHI